MLLDMQSTGLAVRMKEREERRGGNRRGRVVTYLLRPVIMAVTSSTAWSSYTARQVPDTTMPIEDSVCVRVIGHK